MRTSYVITRTSNVIGNTTEVRRIATVEATVKSEKPDGVEEEHMEMSCLETMNLFLGLSMVNDVVFMHAYPLGKARVCSVPPTEIPFFVRLTFRLFKRCTIYTIRPSVALRQRAETRSSAQEARGYVRESRGCGQKDRAY
ncbi:hypothetical protein Y032_0028g1757 [Ancylostoma ceylanicum]|nr:hypothetical protein Y032_0028g1757 [Ancylostoma ceylanicum]